MFEELYLDDTVKVINMFFGNYELTLGKERVIVKCSDLKKVKRAVKLFKRYVENV